MVDPTSEGSQRKVLPLNSGTSASMPFFIRVHLYVQGTIASSSLEVKVLRKRRVEESTWSGVLLT